MSGCMCTAYLGMSWHQDALWQEGKPAESVQMLGVMFFWEMLHPGIYVDVIMMRTIYVSPVPDHVHPFMLTVFLNFSDFFPFCSNGQYAPCQTAKSCSGTVWET